jgi:hypothetical protein
LTVSIGGKLKSLEISLTKYSGEKTIDLRPFMVDVTIYENIFNSSLHGVMTIVDAVGFLSGYGFPILGEELLTFRYAITDDAVPEKILTFLVYKIDSVVNAENMKHKRYLLRFCSIEDLANSTILIQKAYDAPCSEIVKNIMGEYLATSKSVQTLPTKGAQKLIIPQLRPFDAIEFLRRRSISEKKFKAASYVFYENTEGFMFTDIEQLIERGSKKADEEPDVYTYYVTDGSLQRSNESNTSENYSDPRYYNIAEFKTLFSFSQNHRTDTIERIKKGVFQSVVTTFDPVNVEYKEKTFKYNPFRYTTLSPQIQHSAEFQFDFAGADSKTSMHRNFYIMQDSTVPDTHLDDIIPNTASYMTNLAQNMFSASIIGDPRILAGDVINIPFIPAFRNPDQLGLDDKLLSGKFLVAGIRHKFGQESYVCDVELFKNGFAEKVDFPLEL